MDFFNVVTMIGGLALFLYGMNAMGNGLEQLAGGKLEKLLEKLTSNPVKAVLLGAGVTAVIQSSSATTVMVVGFVNSGIMKLTQAVGIIMGANVGTTVTSWILSLTGIESNNFYIKLLKPTTFSPMLAMIGVVLLLFIKNEKKKNIGIILTGFAILMFGMESMSAAVKPLADVTEFTNILTMFSQPLLGMMAGALLTAIIQSSSASVGILQALCLTGSLSFGTAIPIIMGQNIGTCITAILSSIGANKNAKRAALIHLYFNLIGTTIFMVLFYSVNAVFDFSFLADKINPIGIAVIHSCFNIASTIVLLPFTKWLVRLAIISVREEEKVQDVVTQIDFQLLDTRFLDKTAYATEQCKRVTTNMAQLTKSSLFKAIDLLESYSEGGVKEVKQLEDRVDKYEDELGSYLIKLSSKSLSEKDSRTISYLLHCIGDFERISDHAINIMEIAKEIQDKNLKFSNEAVVEVRIYTEAIRDIITTAITAFDTEDVNHAKIVEPLEEAIDNINESLKKRHIMRLRNGVCTIDLGFVLTDLINNYERIADHCSNIAIWLIQLKEDGIESHEYISRIKQADNEEFQRLYQQFKDKYQLPKKVSI
ncbi:MAG: Na/Pi cotransporter family protein [Herbinix sp.]|nr:Na/Pi cotransporter family protein [Herbinix sp.]